MTRLTDLHGELAQGTAVRWDPQSVDVLNALQRARSLRAEFIAGHLRRGTENFVRWSGLTMLFAVLRRQMHRRRTLHELSQLDGRMLSDIGLNRADILATATVCSDQPSACDSVWHQIAAWARRERRRRQTLRALSAMPDNLLSDIGIARADIPAIAASLVAKQSNGETTGEADENTVTAQILTFVETRRGQQRNANENFSHSTAA